MAASKRNTPRFTRADGVHLAVNMLVEMEELGLDELAVDGDEYLRDERRDGRPQSDILVRYLRAAQQHPEVEAGFLAVLTDALGAAAEGGAATLVYERNIPQARHG